MRRIFGILFLVLSVLLATIGNTYGSGATGTAGNGRNAIVMASFGTTVPKAVGAITNITDTVRAAYPETEVRLTFTSNMIRSVWKKRQAEADRWVSLGIPEEVLYVENFIATIGGLLEDGYTNIIVQPTHMFFMEQSSDLKQYVDGLNSIKMTKARWQPFNALVLGRPALGIPGDQYPYQDDIIAACSTLAADAEAARKAGAMLVYMGHGNEYWPTGIYAETERAMREMYPDVLTFVGVVEGAPGIDDLLGRLQHATSKKIILKPFMIVAGDHAVNDMAGPEQGSWTSILSAAGYEVVPILEGLGSNSDFASLFVDHIADAAREKGITLK